MSGHGEQDGRWEESIVRAAQIKPLGSLMFSILLSHIRQVRSSDSTMAVPAHNEFAKLEEKVKEQWNLSTAVVPDAGVVLEQRFLLKELRIGDRSQELPTWTGELSMLKMKEEEEGDPASASDVSATGAAASAPAPASVEKTEKAPKHAPKVVNELDSLIRVFAEVEVYTQGDWWNARIDKVTIVNRKSAEILVSYEQSAGVYENQEGDEIRFEVRQTDGIWVYADRIRARQPGQAEPVLAATSAGGVAAVTAPASPSVALVAASAPALSVNRELSMSSSSGAMPHTSVTHAQEPTSSRQSADQSIPARRMPAPLTIPGTSSSSSQTPGA